MIAMTGAERTRLSRLRKETKEICNNWLKGEDTATLSAFVNAMADETCYLNHYSKVVFDDIIINRFTTLMKTEFKAVKRRYNVIDMLNAWKIAIKIQDEARREQHHRHVVNY